MGESAQLNGPLAGQFGLNDFLRQQNNAATPERIAKLIVPVQEMRDFQRRYRFSSGTRAVGIGQRLASVRFIVPADEWWKPIALQFENTDSSGHQIEVNVTVDNTGLVSIFRIVRTFIVATTRKLIYGTNEDGSMSGAADDQLYTSFWPVTMEPTDVLTLSDLTNATNAITQRWTFVYELVPRPATELTKGVVGLTVVT